MGSVPDDDDLTGASWFAPGDLWVPPPDGADAVTEAQHLFLVIVADAVPRVIASLASDVWPSYHAAATVVRVDEFMGWVSIESAQQSSLAQILAKWSTRNGLYDRWCITQALATLQHWTMQGRPDLEAGWGLDGVDDLDYMRLRRDVDAVLTPVADGSHARYARHRDYLERRKRAIDAAKRLGAVETPAAFIVDHLVWLAWYQCEKVSFGAITDRIDRASSIEVSTVSRMTARAAHLISLTLRPSNPVGRPRTNKQH